MIADFKAEFPPATRVLPTLLATCAAQYGDAGLFACGATRLSYDQTRAAAARAAQADAAASREAQARWIRDNFSLTDLNIN